MRKSLRYALAISVILIVGLAIATYFLAKSLGPRAKARVIQALADRFDANVDLKSLHLYLFPQPKVVGEQTSIRHKGWNDPHPLIYIRRFTASASYATLFGRTNKVDFVRLEGLQIHVPSRGRSAAQPEEDTAQVASAEPGHDTTTFRFLIETINADGTLLEIEPKIQGKVPLAFDIQKLMLHSVAPGQPMTFKTTLTNAKPPGLIDSTGEFGPWQRDDPRSTAVSGTYSFQNADLSVFRGITGILSSDGSYHGVLQHIEVDGTTDTPRFALKRGGQPVHLITSFHSIVNGTDGNTILDPVDARFLRTEFVCKGGIIHEPGVNGKAVSLDAITKHGRIEDILRLVIGDQKPILTGGVNFKTTIVIPPGQQDVLDKLKLDGQFGIVSAEFTSSTLQRKLDGLSERAQGIPKNDGEESPDTVASNFNGSFKLDNGIASFSRLSFNVPGALIRLDGAYNLRSERINMKGAFRMHATLSQTQSGIKHWILKPLDRFFEKQGAGFMVPIQVTGTKDHPELTVQIFHRDVTIH